MSLRAAFNAGVLAGATALVVPIEASAQLSASLDGGWATVRYDEYLRSSVYTVAPGVRMEYPSALVAARGTLSVFESGSRSVDLTAAASKFTGALGAFRGEVGVSGGSTIYNGLATGHAAAQLRVHLIAQRTGVWVGGGGGYLDDGISGSGITRLGVGAWSRGGALTVSGSLNHLEVAPFRSTDLEGGLRYSTNAVTVGAHGGWRVSSSEGDATRTWGEASVVYWMHRNVALVGAHGRNPSDLARGTPGGRYTSFALRLSHRSVPAGVLRLRDLRDDLPVVVRPLATRFRLRRDSDSSAVITVRASGARGVEVAGDFTDWTPVLAERRGNSDDFEVRVRVRAGAHKFLIRVDAGGWGVPAGVPVVQDQLGGHVALLIIPPGSG